MSYTVKIKEEISKQTSTRSEVIAELSAYIRNNGTIHNDRITLTTENHFMVDRVMDELKELFGIVPKEEVVENLNFSKNELYQITISEKLDLINEEEIAPPLTARNISLQEKFFLKENRYNSFFLNYNYFGGDKRET